MRFRQHQRRAQASSRQLLLAFALVLLLVVLAANAALALVYRLTLPFTTGYPAWFFSTNTAVVLLFVLGGCWFETLRLREGGPHVARLAGAQPVQAGGHSPAERQQRRLHNVVTEMALAARMSPPPQAWVLGRDDAINAFAAGWAADDAVVVVTRGALERLTRQELQGVVAHEFSHLMHGDTRLHMRLVGLVWGLQMVFTFGRSLVEPDDDGRRSPALPFGLGLMAVGALGWAGGRLLQAAVSRQREHLADASAVQYTRQVDGLGGALRKIAFQSRRHADQLRSPQASVLTHFYLHAPGRRSDGWWATHPPLAERLRRLYGRTVEGLPDEPQPLPHDEPWLGLAPPSPSPSSAAPDGPVGAAGPMRPGSAPPEAIRHDALQNPLWHGEAQREADALTRLARRHGPLELQGVLGALLLDVSDAAGWQRWHAMQPTPTLAASLRDEVGALRMPARLAWLAEGPRRLGAAPAPARAAMRRVARALAPAGAQAAGRRDALAPWRRAVLLRGLHEAVAQPALPHGAKAQAAGWPLAHLLGEAMAASATLASGFGMGPAAAGRWLDAVAVQLGAAPVAGGAPLRWRRLRRLAPMQRPQLARAWAEALDAAPEAGASAQAAELLALACMLLDTPAAPAVVRRLGGALPTHPAAADVAAAALQARSL